MQRLWPKSSFERVFDAIITLVMFGAGLYGLILLANRFQLRLPTF